MGLQSQPHSINEEDPGNIDIGQAVCGREGGGCCSVCLLAVNLLTDQEEEDCAKLHGEECENTE